jgi:tetratricopeptide (TPR) repeat protein
LIPSFLGIILLLCAVKTISRNFDWYDSERLFTTDVKVSRNSAKGNETAGEYLMIRATGIKDKAIHDSLLRVSIRYQQKAISIYPKQIIALINMAAAYNYLNQDYDTMLVIYKNILHYLPNEDHIYQIFNSLMNKYSDIDHKIRLYQSLLEVNRDRWDVNMNLGVLYQIGKGDPDSAIPYYLKSAQLKPSDFTTQNYLGTAYAQAKRWKDAEGAFRSAEKLNPDNPDLLKNLVVVYQNLGNTTMYDEYIQRYNNALKKK